jgi:hypothetical protein
MPCHVAQRASVISSVSEVDDPVEPWLENLPVVYPLKMGKMGKTGKMIHVAW